MLCCTGPLLCLHSKPVLPSPQLCLHRHIPVLGLPLSHAVPTRGSPLPSPPPSLLFSPGSPSSVCIMSHSCMTGSALGTLSCLVFGTHQINVWSLPPTNIFFISQGVWAWFVAGTYLAYSNEKLAFQVSWSCGEILSSFNPWTAGVPHTLLCVRQFECECISGVRGGMVTVHMYRWTALYQAIEPVWI